MVPWHYSLLFALVQVHATLLRVCAEHDVVVKQDESVGVEAEKAVDKDHVDINVEQPTLEFVNSVDHQGSKHDQNCRDDHGNSEKAYEHFVSP